MKTHVLLFLSLLFAFAVQGQTESENDTIPAKEEITTFEEETARAHRSAGDQFFADELYIEAIEAYTKAIAVNPYDRVAWYNRAVSYSRLEDTDAAIHDLSRIIALDDGFVAAYFLRGAYHYELEDFRDAKRDFSDIISIRPNSALTYRKRATVRFQMRDQHGALKDYNESIRINPRDPISFHDRAVTREYLGDKKGAKEDKKKVKELEAALNAKGAE